MAKFPPRTPQKRAAAAAATMPSPRVDSPMVFDSDSDALTDLGDIEERLKDFSPPPPPDPISTLFTPSPLLGPSNPLFSKQTTAASPEKDKLPYHLDLLRYASRKTVPEMVDEVKARDPGSDVMNKRISNRLLEALSAVATDRGVERRDLKAAFEKAKERGGVQKRRYEVSQRKAGQRRRDSGKGMDEDGDVFVHVKEEEEGEGDGTLSAEETLSGDEEGEAECVAASDEEDRGIDDEMEAEVEMVWEMSEEQQAAYEVEEAAHILMRIARESRAILSVPMQVV